MKDSTKYYMTKAAIGLGVCGAVGVACYKTESGWPLLGLVFLPGMVDPFCEAGKNVVEVVTNI